MVGKLKAQPLVGQEGKPGLGFARFAHKGRHEIERKWPCHRASNSYTRGFHEKPQKALGHAEGTLFEIFVLNGLLAFDLFLSYTFHVKWLLMHN